MSSLFIEKYRPKVRADIAGNKQVVDDVFQLAQTGNLLDMIFEGRAGVGKTVMAYALAHLLYGSNIEPNFMELNASDERGIDVVRDKIIEFAKVKPLDAEYKLIFLDEADQLTDAAQDCLKRPIEKYSKITRFIFACNKFEKLIEPIRSRCQVFHFSPLSENDIYERLCTIYLKEKGDIDNPIARDVLFKIAQNSDGDMRKGINRLQTLLSYGTLNMANLQKENRSDVGFQILSSLEQGRFLEARNVVKKLLLLGYTERDAVSLLYQALYIEPCSIKLTPQQRGGIILELSETDYRLTFGVSGGLQLDALLLKVMKVLKV